MRKGIMGLVPITSVKDPAINVATLLHSGEEAQEEAMFVGGEPKTTGPVVLLPDDSQRLWEAVRSKEPAVLTARMQEAVANYRRLMGEVVG